MTVSYIVVGIVALWGAIYVLWHSRKPVSEDRWRYLRRWAMLMITVAPLAVILNYWFGS